MRAEPSELNPIELVPQPALPVPGGSIYQALQPYAKLFAERVEHNLQTIWDNRALLNWWPAPAVAPIHQPDPNQPAAISIVLAPASDQHNSGIVYFWSGAQLQLSSHVAANRHFGGLVATARNHRQNPVRGDQLPGMWLSTNLLEEPVPEANQPYPQHHQKRSSK